MQKIYQTLALFNAFPLYTKQNQDTIITAMLSTPSQQTHIYTLIKQMFHTWQQQSKKIFSERKILKEHYRDLIHQRIYMSKPKQESESSNPDDLLLSLESF